MFSSVLRNAGGWAEAAVSAASLAVIAAARLKRICLIKCSVVDPERFDADPDPTFHADADPDPKLYM